MQIVGGMDGLANLPPGLALSVGNFDGLHRGHARILDVCRSLRSQGATGVAIATFEPHPLTVLRPEFAPPRLGSVAMKRQLLAAAGVDYLVELPPTSDVLNVTAEAFWEILRDQTRPSHLVEGETFNFGKGRGGTIDRLREWAATSSVKLHVIDGVETPLVDLQIVPISSSLIRWLIANGRVRDAAIALGRPYTLRGPVVKGFQRGRTIGVPTANLSITEQLIPAEGVYAGRCDINGQIFAAAVSIGTMPTFGDHPPQIEAHLVGFTGDLYDRVIDLQLIDWIRDQRKSQGIEPLKQQLQRDIATAEQLSRQQLGEPIASIQV
jgi:riboflavin kinase/FMN adenylyltransferase